MTFDNTDVGKAEADAIIAKVPKGNYVLIKGDPGDAERQDLPARRLGSGRPEGQGRVRRHQDHRAGGRHLHHAWDTKKAQTNMEAIIDAAGSSTKIDAILAENDSTALGVAAALQTKNYGFPPLSGQDGDAANLNNVALGKQYVDVWKNSNELGKAAGAAALQLCAGKTIKDVAIGRRSVGRAGCGQQPGRLHDPGRQHRKSIILKRDADHRRQAQDRHAMQAGGPRRTTSARASTASDPARPACQ